MFEMADGTMVPIGESLGTVLARPRGRASPGASLSSLTASAYSSILQVIYIDNDI